MERVKKWLSRAALATAGLAIFGVLFATLRAGGADTPTREDAKKALREARPAPDTGDVRVALAPSGWIAGQGIVEPADREVKLGATQPGVIRRLLVKEGAGVVAGQPLVEMDDEVEKAALLAAEADWTSAKVQLARTREGKRPEDQRAAQADARSAEARAALSRATEKRTAALVPKGAATADDLDRAQFQAQADTATAEAQRARAEAAMGGWRRDIEVSEAQLRQAEANLEQAQAKLARLTIRAPMAGTVLQLVVREGEYYNPAAQSLATLGDLGHIRVRLDVDERNAAQVHVGQRGYAIVEAYGARRFPGTLVEVGRRMGRKNLRTDEPTERIDTKILEVVLQLDGGQELVQGVRAIGYLDVASAAVTER